jgi:hypothetical protein
MSVVKKIIQALTATASNNASNFAHKNTSEIQFLFLYCIYIFSRFVQYSALRMRVLDSWPVVAPHGRFRWPVAVAGWGYVARWKGIAALVVCCMRDLDSWSVVAPHGRFSWPAIVVAGWGYVARWKGIAALVVCCFKCVPVTIHFKKQYKASFNAPQTFWTL